MWTGSSISSPDCISALDTSFPRYFWTHFNHWISWWPLLYSLIGIYSSIEHPFHFYQLPSLQIQNSLMRGLCTAGNLILISSLFPHRVLECHRLWTTEVSTRLLYRSFIISLYDKWVSFEYMKSQYFIFSCFLYTHCKYYRLLVNCIPSHRREHRGILLCIASSCLFWNLLTSSIVISVILDMYDLEYLFWNIVSSIPLIFVDMPGIKWDDQFICTHVLYGSNRAVLNLPSLSLGIFRWSISPNLVFDLK